MKPLHEIKPDTLTAHKDCIKYLEGLLETLKGEGAVVGIALCTVNKDGSIGSSWSASAFNKFTMVGSMENLKNRFFAAEIEG